MWIAVCALFALLMNINSGVCLLNGLLLDHWDYSGGAKMVELVGIVYLVGLVVVVVFATWNAVNCGDCGTL